MLLIAAIVGLFLLPEPWNVIAVAAAAVIEVGEVWLWTRYLRRFRVHGGAEGMVGERGEVIEPCDPEGSVRAHGEIWRARAERGAALPAGERVVVVAVEGLTLRVARHDGSA